MDARPRRIQSIVDDRVELNALDGATPADAFSVRCDRSTMTQNDLDNGRLVAEIMLYCGGDDRADPRDAGAGDGPYECRRQRR